MNQNETGSPELPTEEKTGRAKCVSELMALSTDVVQAVAAVRHMTEEEYREGEERAIDEYGPDIVYATQRANNERLLVFAVDSEGNGFPDIPNRILDILDVGLEPEEKADPRVEPDLESLSEQKDEPETAPPSDQIRAYRNTIRVLNEKNDKLTDMLRVQIEINQNQMAANKLLLEMGEMAGSLLNQS